MKNTWYFFLFVALTVTCLVIFNMKIQQVPPLGKFLDPFQGFWQNAESRKSSDLNIESSHLKAGVSIAVDENGIPHVFAENEADLYFAQGYITAKDRLWQMDFQTRFAAGRLSEVVGKDALELDRYQRRTGMVRGAEEMLLESMRDPHSKMIIEAYAAGVNAYIEELSPRHYPIEFKLLNYAPEKWHPINSAFLLKLMSATLARGSNELALNNILERFGPKVVGDLFPDDPPRHDPIIPSGTPWNFAAGVAQGTPNDHSPKIAVRKASPSAKALYQNGLLPKGIVRHALLTAVKPDNMGSNNWAIDGSKSASGLPLLANDPHLDLTLPSIWYQIQLHGPEINVYGVSIPGAPNVIIGFNRSVAWGVTNVGSDVLDWFNIRFKDDSKREYWHDGAWRKTKMRIEEIKIKGAASVFDTVFYTHHGPVSYPTGSKPANFSMADNIPEDHALSWVAHLPSNELRTFYELNKAKDYDDYRASLSYFTAPAQNFVFADNSGTIAITANGLFPFKEKRQGKFLLDGSEPREEWARRIPFAHNPTVKNPERGFVSSANQWPVDSSYPYYLGWEFAPYERGHRINQLLTQASAQTIDDFVFMQNDNFSVLARDILPILLASLSSLPNFTPTESEGLKLLKAWNYRYDADETAATIFESWYFTLQRKIWSDEFINTDTLMRSPGRDRTVRLLMEQAESPWYAINETPHTRAQLAQLSFRETIQSLSQKHGKLGNWQWGTVRKSHVPHLADIPGFGSPALKVGGVGHAVNAMGESNGPSWRMVVQLGEKPTAFGIVPGGQSGNPGSRFYDNQLEVWQAGKLNELLFLDKPDATPEQISNMIYFKPTP